MRPMRTLRPFIPHFPRLVLWTLPLAPLAWLASVPLSVCAEPPLTVAEALLNEGDQLADAKQYVKALGKYQQGFELILPQLRQRPFLRPVAARIMRRTDLQKYMVKELATELSPSDALFLDRAVKLFGLAPEKLDIEQMMLELFTEQVAGFYNSRTKELFLIAERPAAQRSLWARVFGPDEFDSEEQKATLSHEMAHAIADQHFDLNQFDRMTEDNEDASLAISALIEGEAMLVMMAEMTRERDRSGQDVLRLKPQMVDRLFSMMSLTSVGGGKAMRNAPPFFRRALVFPYHQGTVFLAHLANHGGWEAVDQALRFPPVSTEQILHPEKYLRPDLKDAPIRVAMPNWDDLLAGWKALGDDTLGEYQIRLLLHDQPDGEQAAAGWGGDRYLVMQQPLPPVESPAPARSSATKSAARAASDDALMLWHTTWDSNEDAREFASCYTRDAQRKLRLPTGPDVTVATTASRHSRTAKLEGGKRPQWVQHSGRNVLVVVGQASNPTELLERLGQCRHGAWNYRLPPVEAP